jgi:hypothetical protein
MGRPKFDVGDRVHPKYDDYFLKELHTIIEVVEIAGQIYYNIQDARGKTWPVVLPESCLITDAEYYALG